MSGHGALQSHYDIDEAVIERLMNAQNSLDWDKMSGLLADDAVFEMPFIHEKLAGKDTILARWRPSLERMDGLRFHDLALRPMAEAGWYVGTFRNTCTVRTTGLIYDQDYLAMFHVRDGKVVYFGEYFDTLRLAVALRRVETFTTL